MKLAKSDCDKLHVFRIDFIFLPIIWSFSEGLRIHSSLFRGTINLIIDKLRFIQDIQRSLATIIQKEIMLDKVDKNIVSFDLLIDISERAEYFFKLSGTIHLNIETANILTRTFLDLVDLLRVRDQNFENNFYNYSSRDILKIEETLCSLFNTYNKSY